MAQHQSAKKRIRRNERRRVINGNRIGRIRTYVKAVETAIEDGDAVAAKDALKAAQPEIHRGVTKGVVHKNTANRKLSRLAARVNAMG